jgi:hypothetical protein
MLWSGGTSRTKTRPVNTKPQGSFFGNPGPEAK